MAPTALTLADMMNLAETRKDYITAGVIDTLRHESDVMAMLSFKSLGTLRASGRRVRSLPTAQNRQVNGTYAHSSGSVEVLEEDGYIYGGEIHTDRIYKDAAPGMMTGDPEAQNIDWYATSIAYSFNDDLINNTPSAKPEAIRGLRYRLRQDFSGQIIDAGGLDISPDAASLTTNFNKFYDAVQSAIYACDKHTCDALLMNDTTKLRAVSGLRQLGLFSTTVDQVGKTVETWGPGGPMLLDMGTKQDQTTKIMPDTEGATGLLGGGTLTSIIPVKFGETYLEGWQLNEIQTYNWQQGVAIYDQIDWYAGIFITHQRFASWLINIQSL